MEKIACELPTQPVGVALSSGVLPISRSDPKRKVPRVISEVPYGMNKATLLEKIADLVKEKKIVGISDLRDESARGVVRVVVD